MKWEPVFEGNICIGVGELLSEDYGKYYRMVCNSILPDTDEEYEEKRNHILRDMYLIAAAPMMLETLKEIAKGQGRYDRDKLKHCANAVEDMMKLAEEAIYKIEPF